MKLTLVFLALASVAFGHDHDEWHTQHPRDGGGWRHGDAKHPKDNVIHHKDYHHSGHHHYPHHSDGKDKMEAVAHACRHDIEICRSEDKEDLLSMFACAHKNVASLSEPCRATVVKYFPALFFCAEDVASSCPMIGHGAEEKGVRCIDEARSSFSPDCSDAIAKVWAHNVASEHLDEHAQPSSLDIYKMLTPPPPSHHQEMYWPVSYSLAVMFAGVGSIMATALGLRCCVKMCCGGSRCRGCSRRRAEEAEASALASPVGIAVNAPYPPPVATPLAVHIHTATAPRPVWACAQCTLENDAESATCQACGCQRASAPAPATAYPAMTAVPIIAAPVATHVPVYPPPVAPPVARPAGNANDFSYHKLN